jgi:hypothetical protein
MITDNAPIEFALKSIRTDEFATLPYSPTAGEDIRLATNVNFGINTELKEITVIFRAAFEAVNKPFIILQASCVFDVKAEDFNKFPYKDQKTVDVRRDFLAHLATLTIGTARGILHTKLEYTPFSNHFLLPVINVSDIAIKEDTTSTEPNVSE